LKPTRVKQLPRERAKVYLTRAENLLRKMDLAEREKNSDGIATTAVQAAVALGDAYTIHFLRERCRGQDHHEVITLVARINAPCRGEVGPLISRILDRKSAVEYEDRAVTLNDAKELARWVRALSGLVHSDLQP
jgi:hypothetical protein